MKYGIRECADVVLRAKSAQKIGNKIFYRNEPVCYFDTLKTSTLEGAATTVYAQGGRGNSRLMSWDGERTITFTMEDALISPDGLAILTGAGLIEASQDKSINQHVTKMIDKLNDKVTVNANKLNNLIDDLFDDSEKQHIYLEGEVYTIRGEPISKTNNDLNSGNNSILALGIKEYVKKWINDSENHDTQGSFWFAPYADSSSSDEGGIIYAKTSTGDAKIIYDKLKNKLIEIISDFCYMASDSLVTIDNIDQIAYDNNDCIYLFGCNAHGDIITEPYVLEKSNNKLILKYGINNINNYPNYLTCAMYKLDYYIKHESGAFQIDITPDKFGGNYYLEASTLWRDQVTGADHPAQFVIPNCRVQSNFTFTMASSGDPSSFTFTLDAFPDYTRWDKEHKVLAQVQVFDDLNGSNEPVRKKTWSDDLFDDDGNYIGSN